MGPLKSGLAATRGRRVAPGHGQRSHSLMRASYSEGTKRVRTSGTGRAPASVAIFHDPLAAAPCVAETR